MSQPPTIGWALVLRLGAGLPATSPAQYLARSSPTLAARSEGQFPLGLDDGRRLHAGWRVRPRGAIPLIRRA